MVESAGNDQVPGGNSSSWNRVKALSQATIANAPMATVATPTLPAPATIIRPRSDRIGPEEAATPRRKGDGDRVEDDEDPDEAADIGHVRALLAIEDRLAVRERHVERLRRRRCPTRSRH